MFCTVMYWTGMYCTVMYWTAHCHTFLYCIIMFPLQTEVMSLVKERLVGVEGKGVVMAGFPRLAEGSFWSFTWFPPLQEYTAGKTV